MRPKNTLFNPFYPYLLNPYNKSRIGFVHARNESGQNLGGHTITPTSKFCRMDFQPATPQHHGCIADDTWCAPLPSPSPGKKGKSPQLG